MLTNSISALNSSQVTNCFKHLKYTRFFNDIKESDGLIIPLSKTEIKINNELANVNLHFEAYHFSRLYLIASTYFDDGDKYAQLKLSMEGEQATEEFKVMTNHARNYHPFKPIVQARNISESGVGLNDTQPLPEGDIESHLPESDGLNDHRKLPPPPSLLTLEYTQALYKGLAQTLRNEVLSHQQEKAA